MGHTIFSLLKKLFLVAITEVQFFVLSVAILIINGCASVNVETQWKQIESMSSCCSGFQNIQFTKIPFGQEIQTEINESNLIIEFPDKTKSFFVAYSLPLLSDPSEIQFKATLSSGFLYKATTLIPRFAFLDTSKSLITLNSQTKLRPATTALMGSYFQGAVPVPLEAN